MTIDLHQLSLSNVWWGAHQTSPNLHIVVPEHRGGKYGNMIAKDRTKDILLPASPYSGDTLVGQLGHCVGASDHPLFVCPVAAF